MILYNTLMGVCAGLGLILVTLLGRSIVKRQLIAPEGWALALGSVGAILTFLSTLMAVTWPLTVNPPINIIFAEPNVLFGVLMIAAAIFLWRQKEVVTALASSNKATSAEAAMHLRRVFTPVAWVIFSLGLVLAASSIAIFRFGIVGSAPELEPITGLLHDYPVVENTFFGILYALPAIGALLVPFAIPESRATLRTVIGYCWLVSGVVFLLFSSLNYYTHTGMLMNIKDGTQHRI